jgi:triosephosphate isomerase
MAANWKMYKTASQTVAYFERFRPLLQGPSPCDIVICPPLLSLPAAVSAASGSNIAIGGQNMYWEKEGAYTGEISGEMLYAEGASWVLVGHSERRRLFCENDSDVLKKAQAAIEANLSPIICMGERLDEHKAGKAYDVLIRQFASGVAGLTEEQFAKTSIAYEPIWAIGTGQTATPDIASEAHQIIRSEVEKRFGSDAAAAVRIIYGGSVKPDNIAGLMAEPDIDGVLVGGASLDPVSFAKIVQAA